VCWPYVSSSLYFCIWGYLRFLAFLFSPPFFAIEINSEYLKISFLFIFSDPLVVSFMKFFPISFLVSARFCSYFFSNAVPPETHACFSLSLGRHLWYPFFRLSLHFCLIRNSPLSSFFGALLFLLYDLDIFFCYTVKLDRKNFPFLCFRLIELTF